MLSTDVLDAANPGQPAHQHIRLAYPQVPLPHSESNTVAVGHQKMGNIRHEPTRQTNNLAGNISMKRFIDHQTDVQASPWA